VDLLPLVPRRQLVEIVKQLGDRQFASILQFFLTEVGQITFNHLRFVAPRNINGHSNNGGPIVEVLKEMPAFFFGEWKIPRPSDLKATLAEGPMPNNVKDFKSIQLRFAMHIKLNITNFKAKIRSYIMGIKLAYVPPT
jgi:hypothetical protein